MAPDLNSLPPSRSMSSSPMQTRATGVPVPIPNRHDTPSPRSSSVSLAAAATMNAADISRRSSTASNSRGSPRQGRGSDRRRSQVAMNLSLNDPTLPSPGELSGSDPRSNIGHSFSTASPTSIGGNRVIGNGDPHHNRTPSLGEIHQELEQEQEATVNRMLQMIRRQQEEYDRMRQSHPEHPSRRSSLSTSTAAVAGGSNAAAILDDLTPASERTFNLPTAHSNQNQAHATTQPMAVTRTFSTRRSSHSQSTSRSPALRAHEHPQSSTSYTSDFPPSPSMSLLESATVRRNSNSLRDEATYYQAETASLTRENQMLRLRIRELERQLGEANLGHDGGRRGSQANVPSVPSPLVAEGGVEKS